MVFGGSRDVTAILVELRFHISRFTLPRKDWERFDSHWLVKSTGRCGMRAARATAEKRVGLVGGPQSPIPLP